MPTQPPLAKDSGLAQFDAERVLAETVAHSTYQNVLPSLDRHAAFLSRNASELLMKSRRLRSRAAESGNAEADWTAHDTHVLVSGVVVDVQRVAAEADGLRQQIRRGLLGALPSLVDLYRACRRNLPDFPLRAQEAPFLDPLAETFEDPEARK